MSFGGSPRCTSCGGAVYHAEQVMGPARKVYHKMCLKCMNCGKRLDPGGLVEHDTEPYCSRCHTQLFGTRDLRHANVFPSSPAMSTTTPTRPSAAAAAAAASPLPTTPTPVLINRARLPPTPDFYTPPSVSAPGPGPATSASASIRLEAGDELTRPNFRAERPISVPFAGGIKALDERGMLRKGESPRSKVGERAGVSDDMCGGCGKRVYAAEQIVAVYQKWHRGCLRCNSCKTTLDPSKISDKEGVPHCKNCYHKLFGPGGIR